MSDTTALLATVSALQDEVARLRRDRNSWRSMATALSERNAELRAENLRLAPPFGHVDGRPDGNADARGVR